MTISTLTSVVTRLDENRKRQTNYHSTTLELYNYSHTQTFSLATPDDTKRDGAAHSHHHTNRHQLQHRH